MSLFDVLERDFPDVWHIALEETKGDKVKALVLLKSVFVALKATGQLPNFEKKS